EAKPADLTAPPPPLADAAVKADTSPPREPIDLNGNDLAEISLHSVDSISDLYWVSGGHKAAEGELVPLLQVMSSKPVVTMALGKKDQDEVGGPEAPPTGFPLSPAVLQSESLRVLSQWLEAQEESVGQMKATSLQLWKRLNVSEAKD
uniref:Uncharacterized protein n=1 Tax=Gopherus agassizii TaxID=38772 RepID=A0A452HT00_9SAUR